MPKFMWGLFQKERSLKGWVIAAAAPLLLSTLIGGLFVFSSRGSSPSRPTGPAHVQSATGSWWPTSPLPAARTWHTATLLSNGKVLVVGGSDSGLGFTDQATAYLYDPATATWTQTGSMHTPRSQHTATLLPNGKVLVVGGFSQGEDAPRETAELYDPTTGSWKQTGSMHTPRAHHTATLLPNGQVLVVGGLTNSRAASVTTTLPYYPTSTAELYDPTSGSWTQTGSLQMPLTEHTATLLPNGRVLVVGGVNNPRGDPLAFAELYDPASGFWTSTGFLQKPRAQHTATLLKTGKVLVVGGVPYNSYQTSAELYDSASGSWTFTGSMQAPHNEATATLLSNGQVLVADADSPSELYDPATGSWTLTGSMRVSHSYATATLLPNGHVLVVGGFGPDLISPIQAFAEFFDPLASPPTLQGTPQGFAPVDTPNHLSVTTTM